LKRGPRAAPLDMGSKARTAADQTRLIVDDYRARGFTVVGYGAAAKGNTFLNYADIKLDYVVDDNPLKQGLMTPGTNIPIVESSHLAELKRPFGPLLIVALAWNFFDEIRARVKAMRPKVSDKFLTYFPQVAVRD
jgi:hypothetical protein